MLLTLLQNSLNKYNPHGLVPHFFYQSSPSSILCKICLIALIYKAKTAFIQNYCNKFFLYTGYITKFDIVESGTTQALPYEIASVMHPRSQRFADRGTHVLFAPSSGTPLKYAGTNAEPSWLDYLHINLLYSAGEIKYWLFHLFGCEGLYIRPIYNLHVDAFMNWVLNSTCRNYYTCKIQSYSCLISSSWWCTNVKLTCLIILKCFHSLKRSVCSCLLNIILFCIMLSIQN